MDPQGPAQEGGGGVERTHWNCTAVKGLGALGRGGCLQLTQHAALLLLFAKPPNPALSS